MSLSWENLVCGYADREPLNSAFTGQISSPGIFAVTGPNGCGKSTLLKTWLGLSRPQAGKVLINGIAANLRHDLSQGIGYVPQSHRVNGFFQVTVADFVRQGFGPKHVRTPEFESRVHELLEQWPDE